MKRSLDAALDERPLISKRSRVSSRFLEAFSDEIILHVLSYLDAFDICTTELVNRRLASLCNDSLLWKQLYHSQFSRVRQSAGNGRTNLPLRQLGHISSRDKLRINPPNWKKRYHVRSNWLRGRCKATTELVPNSAKFVQSRTYELRDRQLYIDQDLHDVILIQSLDAVYETGPSDIVLLVADQMLLMYDVHRRKICDKLNLPKYKSLLYQDNFVAVLGHNATISLYSIEDRIRLISALKGSSNTSPILNIREMDPYIVVSLTWISHGLVDSAICLQEMLLSKQTHSLSSTRLATSEAAPHLRLKHVTAHRDTKSVDEHALLYHHPYVLVPHENYIQIINISSTPEHLKLGKGQLLFGFGSTIGSCHINKPFRLVIGSGRAGVRLWDLESNALGSSGFALADDQAVDKHFRRAAAADDLTSLVKITEVLETRIVAANAAGETRILDFDV